MSLFVEDFDVGLHEILLISLADVDELLWIEVVQREPGTLHLNHDAMPLLETMGDVRQGKLYLCQLPGLEGFRMLEAVAIPAPHHLSSH